VIGQHFFLTKTAYNVLTTGKLHECLDSVRKIIFNSYYHAQETTMKYLHTMIRIKDLDQSVDFFTNKLGLVETRRKENEAGRFTLIFMATAPGEPEIELTYNWDQETDYGVGRNFGHLAYSVENIYEYCQMLMDKGVTILRPPRDGYMAFIRTPDQISIEFLQEGEKLPIQEPWASMENQGSW
jgi:lactoylglutathione lyase